jgi:hypothetical protein
MGSEPTTFQLVVQYRNQMHHQEPLVIRWCLVKYLVTIYKVVPVSTKKSYGGVKV